MDKPVSVNKPGNVTNSVVIFNHKQEKHPILRYNP